MCARYELITRIEHLVARFGLIAMPTAFSSHNLKSDPPVAFPWSTRAGRLPKPLGA